MHHLFYSSFSNREKKSYLKAKITKGHFNTITLSNDLPRKQFQLPNQQISDDILTEKGINGKEIIRGNLTAGGTQHVITFLFIICLRDTPKKV